MGSIFPKCSTSIKQPQKQQPISQQIYPSFQSIQPQSSSSTQSQPNSQPQPSSSSLQPSPSDYLSTSAPKLSSAENNQLDQTKIGVPHIDTQAWQYLRNGKTKALTKLFQQQLITCNSVIVPASGHSIPHQAIVLDRREYFKLCEVYGANWDQQDKNGVTALMKAVALNRVYYVERLLELGADTEVKDHRGRDALWYGRFYQAWEAVDLLQESK